MTASRSASLRYTVVIPTIGRPSLVALLESLAASGPDDPFAPDEVVVVDDRLAGAAPLSAPPLPLSVLPLSVLPLSVLPLSVLPLVGGRRPRVLRAGARGPAAARNLGWRASSAPWVAFLDDDVLLPAGWTAALAADLNDCGPDVAGSQGRLDVPLPPGRPTDFARGTAGLMKARWATADMAYRRDVLVRVGGFDERFPRAYREDADLALRVQRAGWKLTRGRRLTWHQVRPGDDWVSLRAQAGNADDALMRRLHGRRWRAQAGAPRGALRRHVAVTACASATVVAATTGRRRLAAVSSGVAVVMTAWFAVRRILPGPRPGQPGWAAEWRRMLLTSVAIPPAAVVHRLVGEWRFRRGVPPWPPRLAAVLLDRDGTLVEDVPYNGNPAAVRPMPGAAEAVRRLRGAGLRVGVVSNQSGIGRGLLTTGQVDAVNGRVDELLGPFDTWQVCPHAPAQRCACRKPAPGLVRRAARALGVPPEQCAVVGDIGADVDAALAAGAQPVLVPTPVTLGDEVSRAPVVAGTLLEAVDLLLRSARVAELRPRKRVVPPDHGEGAGVVS